MTDTPTPAPEHATGPADPVNPEVRFERSDADTNGVLWFVGGLVVLILVSVGGMWLLMVSLNRAEREEKKPQDYWTRKNGEDGVPSFTRPQVKPTGEDSELNRDPHSGLPPRPYLEKLRLEKPTQIAGPVREITIQEQVAEEEQRLAEYGRSKSEKGIVHIPITEAMKRLAGKLPARQGNSEPEFLQAPSRSSSGQKPRGGGS